MAATGGAGSSSASTVICSLQGAFAPPHKGHAGSAFRTAVKLLELYPAVTDFTIFFMPTSSVASKESLSRKTAIGVADNDPTISSFVSEQERKDMLDIYCQTLNSLFGDPAGGKSSEITSALNIDASIPPHPGKLVTFAVSEIEYALGSEGKGTATINTLEKLREVYPDAIRVLAMGEDNGRQLPWWGRVKEYPVLIDAMIFVDREPPVPAEFVSTIPYASSYRPGDRAVMLFAGVAPWGIKINDKMEKAEKYTVPELFEKDPEGIGAALLALGAKTHLVPAPAPYSSTEVRNALRTGDIDTVRTMCGKDVQEYMTGKAIGIRTKGTVKTGVTDGTLKGGRRHRSRRQPTRRRRGLKGKRTTRHRRR